MLRQLIRKFRAGTPVNRVSNVRDHNRMASFINSIRGIGCRVIVKPNGDNLDALVVVDGKSTDVVPPDGEWPFGAAPVPTDPSPYTTIGGTTEGDEAAATNTWTYGDESAGEKIGCRLYVQTRQAYFHAGDKKWYAYVRLIKISKDGLIYSVGSETRVEIDAPVAHSTL